MRAVDAFEVGRRLSFDDGKTKRIVNYLLEKAYVRKSEWIPINTGDALPLQNFLIIFITSAGIDKLENKESRESVSDIHHHYEDTYQDVEKSNDQIGIQESTQAVNISDSKSKELTEILNQLRSKINDLQTEQRMEIQSNIAMIENELASHRQDKTRVENGIGSLYNKIKDITPLLEIAIQIANWFKPSYFTSFSYKEY